MYGNRLLMLTTRKHMITFRYLGSCIYKRTSDSCNDKLHNIKLVEINFRSAKIFLFIFAPVNFLYLVINLFSDTCILAQRCQILVEKAIFQN